MMGDPKNVAPGVNILFIEGFCIAPWMHKSFLKGPSKEGKRPFDGNHCYRVWCTDFYDEDDERIAITPDAYGIDKCVVEIQSGKYQAIVVVDYSNPDSMTLFDRCLGSHLQKFVAKGGVVAFPSSEGGVVLLPTLKKFFDVEWEQASYYRTTWSPCEENMEIIHSKFGNGKFSRHVLEPYSAKGVSLTSVPVHERCYRTNKHSMTQSMVPTMNGIDVSENEDTLIAMHEYGKGAIAYFGDVNGEDQTIWLIASFVESRASKQPIDSFSALSESDFATVMQYKSEGNNQFGASKWDQAEQTYKAALDLFDNKLGSNGPQRETLVALLSNLSLVYLKKELYYDAERVAGRCLDIEWGHSKTSYRRATARLHISQMTRDGDMPRIQGALKDVSNCDHGDATRKLLLKIRNEQKRMENREREQFRSGFAEAMSG